MKDGQATHGRISHLILEEIKKVAKTPEEEEFLKDIIKKELYFASYGIKEEDSIRKEYKYLLDTYFPYSPESDNLGRSEDN